MMETLERAFAHNLLDFVHAAQQVVPDLRAAGIPSMSTLGEAGRTLKLVSRRA